MSASAFDAGGIRVLGALHGRLELALEVRRQVEAFQPQAIAVELPTPLTDAVLRAVKRLPFLSVVLYASGEDRVYLPIEPTDAMVEALRLGLERGLPVALVDRDQDAYPLYGERVPDAYAVHRIGHEAYARAFVDAQARGAFPMGPEDALREQTMAARCQELAAKHGRVLLVCGLAHVRGVLERLGAPQPIPLGRVRREQVQLCNLSEASSREVMAEIPFLAAAYEAFRAGPESLRGPERFDRLAHLDDLIRRAAQKVKERLREEIAPSQLRILSRFARNQALLAGRLAPDFYQLIVAARGAAHDDFAYEAWELGASYPHQDRSCALPTVEVRGEDLYLDGRKLAFRRRLPRKLRTLTRVPLKPRPRELEPGEWCDKWKGRSICSFPPEDRIIEGYGESLRKKAMGLLSSEQARVEPFASSLKDGIDVRETLRHLGIDGRIFVREERAVRGGVGAVVVVFDEDAEGDRYPWTATWWGEHDQESDMALYATPPGTDLVGPGISRCEYGGLLLTMPPQSLPDVWKNRALDEARSKSERLLWAAIDHAEEKHVVYVARRPPRGQIKSLAARLGKKVVYVPAGQLSPVKLWRLRTFHVLDSQRVRAFAGDYIR